MGNALPLPEAIPTPTHEQAEQLAMMGLNISNEVGADYQKCTIPDGWHWEDESRLRDLPDWKLIDIDNKVRMRVDGLWKYGYDQELRLTICEPGTVWVPSYEWHLKQYAKATRALETQQQADDLYANLMEIYGTLSVNDQRFYGKPTQRMFEDDYTKRLKRHLKDLQFATSPEGASRGYGKLPRLIKLRKENPDKHDEIIGASEVYQELYSKFTGWSASEDQIQKYINMDKGPIAAILLSNNYPK